MKRTILSFLPALLLAMTACTTQEPAGYTVSGTAEGTTDGDTVYICEMVGYFNLNPTDTTVVKDGKFELTGSIEGAALRFLVPMHNGEPTTMALFILENADIQATLGKGDSAEHKIEAGPNGKLYEEYTKGEEEINQKIAEIQSILLRLTD